MRSLPKVRIFFKSFELLDGNVPIFPIPLELSISLEKETAPALAAAAVAVTVLTCLLEVVVGLEETTAVLAHDLRPRQVPGQLYKPVVQQSRLITHGWRLSRSRLLISTNDAPPRGVREAKPTESSK